MGVNSSQQHKATWLFGGEEHDTHTTPCTGDARVTMTLQLCPARLVDKRILWIIGHIQSLKPSDPLSASCNKITQSGLILHWNVHSRQPRVQAEALKGRKRVSLLRKRARVRGVLDGKGPSGTVQPRQPTLSCPPGVHD
jgi:hypothetical protein